MTGEEFQKLKQGDKVVMKDAELLGKPVTGMIMHSYMFDLTTRAKWTLVVNRPGLRLNWTPSSDEEFMRRLDLVD